jgi:uncharacterized repeat protein (TIGR01451 family)
VKIIKIKSFLMSSAAILVLSSSLTTASIAAPHAIPGTIIQNQVIVTYKDGKGNRYTNQSNIIKISIREVNSVTLTNNSGETQTAGNIPNALVYSIHTLHNTGNITDTYHLKIQNETIGDTLNATEFFIYKDKNSNGQLDGDEKKPITTIELASDVTAKLIITSKLPENIDSNDTLNIKVSAESKKNTNIIALNRVKINFSDTRPKIKVVLSAAKDIACDGNPDVEFGDVNLNPMAPMECLILHIQAENTSKNEALDVLLKDIIPEFTSYKENSLQYCKGKGCSLDSFTDAVDNDAAEFDEENDEVKFKAGNMLSGESASARFTIIIK